MAAFVYIHGGDCLSLEHTFKEGVPTVVTDERCIGKLRAHPHFCEVIDGVEVVGAEPKKRGRPPKAK